MDDIKKIYENNKQFIKYSIVSMFCTVILYFLYFLITWLTNGRYIIANLIAYIVSFSVLFILDQKLFNSKPDNKKDTIKQLSAFVIFRVIGFTIDSSLLVLFIEKMGLINAIAKISSSLITFLFNYIVNKLFVFKNKSWGNDNEVQKE